MANKKDNERYVTGFTDCNRVWGKDDSKGNGQAVKTMTINQALKHIDTFHGNGVIYKLVKIELVEVK